jgi:hypothetical protein
MEIHNQNCDHVPLPYFRRGRQKCGPILGMWDPARRRALAKVSANSALIIYS